MKAKPHPGQRVRLLGHGQHSRAGFSVEVVVVDALTQGDTLSRSMRPRAESLGVLVRLPDGATVWVQRGDLTGDVE